MQRLKMDKDKDLIPFLNYQAYNHLHTHDFWEFLLVLDGVYLHHVNGEGHTLNKNAFSVIRPTDEHSTQALTPTTGEINLQISDKTMRAVFSSLPVDLLPALRSPSFVTFYVSERTKQTLYTIALRLQSSSVDEYDKKLLRSQLFLTFVQEIVAHFHSDNTNEQEEYLPECVSRMISLLNDKENLGLNVSEILAPLNYSYVHLSRLFKQYMKIPLAQYFVSVKLTYARFLLEETPMSVIEIASAVGYFSLSHFNTAFKKRYGVPPSKYRKNWRKNYPTVN